MIIKTQSTVAGGLHKLPFPWSPHRDLYMYERGLGPQRGRERKKEKKKYLSFRQSSFPFTLGNASQLVTTTVSHPRATSVNVCFALVFFTHS